MVFADRNDNTGGGDDEKEELVELAERGVEGRGVLVVHGHTLERQSKLGERSSFLDEYPRLLVGQDVGEGHGQ